MNRPTPQVLKLAALRTDGETQPRAQIDTAIVQEFAQAMRDGAEFPPLTVFFDETDHWLADGFHRLAAYREAEIDQAPCDLRTGTLAEARWFSFGANQAHGLRRTNADKVRAVNAALQHSPQRSDSEIARHVGVHHSMVSARRLDLGLSFAKRKIDAQPPGASPELPKTESPPPDEAPAPAEHRIVKRGGKDYTMNVSGIGKGRGRPKIPAPGKIRTRGVTFHPPVVGEAPIVVQVPAGQPARAASVLNLALGKNYFNAVIDAYENEQGART